MTETKIFDHRIRQMHLHRAKASAQNYDFLFKEVANRLVERLREEFKMKFENALDLGSRCQEILVLPEIKKITRAEIDRETLLYPTNSFDLVFSSLSLHWVNDLPGLLLQIKNILKDKGLFICSIFGGNTLTELRQVMNEAEIELRGGMAPRISPYVDIKNAGMLLQKAGFHLPVADTDTIIVQYPDLKSLIYDIRGMGETNAMVNRHELPLTKTLLQSIEQKYKSQFADENGLLNASFEVITMTGWKN